MPFPYQSKQIRESSSEVDNYTQLLKEAISQEYTKSQDWQKIKSKLEETDHQYMLRAITDDLTSINAIAAYVITGGAYGYSFQTAIIQKTENTVQVRRWHDINQYYVEIAEFPGRTDWSKVIACLRKDGCIPDTTINPNLNIGIGRYVTIYVVTKDEKAWSRISTGDSGLCVHKLYNAMVKVEERAFSDHQRKV
ncbi:hypothetical protein VB711_12925 [Cronbergia sp. UHCC 0137]|uniref:hypothetical protein n=1 Tax=Cronbergia sp. UHCC 0137 TaxID=3110239 RepID=UPI002B1EA9DA|nr:hypothetical protein [Cronbergia sp. UHCC 0137]MEA5618734.1 hypothetical protein [Cronbergia sp. UHCC 0137]